MGGGDGARSEPWDYLSSLLRAQFELNLMTRGLLFFGHTHVPAIYAFTEHPFTKHPFTKHSGRTLARSVPLTQLRTVYHLPPNACLLVNPSSVGQPRDGVPLASYTLFDDEARTLEHHRVPFDIKRVQNRVRAAGYPESLAARLERGR